MQMFSVSNGRVSDFVRSCAYMVIWHGHGCMCLYSDLEHAWVRVYIEVFRFAIERFISCRMKES